MDAGELEAFEEQIGTKRNPEKEALKALKAYQEQAGIVIEDPDAPVAPDAKGLALMEDQEIPGEWMRR